MGFLGSMLGGMAKGAARGALGTAKFAGKSLYNVSRNLVEGSVGAGAGLFGGTAPAAARTTMGASIGHGIGRTAPKLVGGVAGAAYSTGKYIGGTALPAANAVGSGLGKALFKHNPGGHPLPYTMKTGAIWGVGLGALGIGAGLGVRDSERQKRMGTMVPQGKLNELSYDGQTGHDKSLGASGDLVLALNNLR